MFTFLVSNSDVDYRLVEKYFPNCCWTTPIGKLARATRDRIAIKLASIYSTHTKFGNTASVFPGFNTAAYGPTCLQFFRDNSC